MDAATGIEHLYDFHGSITECIDKGIASLGADPGRCEMSLEEPEPDAMRCEVTQDGQPVGYLRVFWLSPGRARVVTHRAVPPWLAEIISNP